jgi:hypothetical protein
LTDAVPAIELRSVFSERIVGITATVLVPSLILAGLLGLSATTTEGSVAAEAVEAALIAALLVPSPSLTIDPAVVCTALVVPGVV